MHPVICTFGPFTIYSYGLMVVLAFSIAALMLSRQAKRQGLSQEMIFNLSFIVLASGIIGARFLYIVLNFNYYLNNPVEIVMLNRGGLAWFGGLIFACISGVIYLRHKRLDVYRTLDLVVPYAALGQSIGRIGCFLNGCCYGRQALRFGIYFPVNDAILIPTQLYSSLALLGIFVILRLKQTRVHRKGEIFYLYLLLYSVWRFFIEFFRADTQIFFFGLTVFQIFCIATFILSLVMLIRIWKSSP
ncbi:MAG: prolipoprotein diacylglyceryl transferase [Candidatus Omnitrophota bacterium]